MNFVNGSPFEIAERQIGTKGLGVIVTNDPGKYCMLAPTDHEDAGDKA